MANSSTVALRIIAIFATWLTFAERLERYALLAAPIAFESHGPGGGGAFFSPRFSPYNPNELYAASDMSGVYRSTNLACSWNIQPFAQLQGGRASAVQFTSDQAILYTTDTRGDVGSPAKSTDGGATWHRLTGWTSSACGTLADPMSTTRLLTWDYRSLYFSSDGGQTFARKFANSKSGSGTYVAGAFFDGKNIYVGTNAGLLVSTDGGTNFTLSSVGGLPTGTAMFSIAGAKQNGTTRLYCALLNAADVFNGMYIEGVATSSYAGIYSFDVGAANWVSRKTTIPAGEYPYFVSAALGDINIIYAAGASNAGAPIVIKSTNAGANWANVLITKNNQNAATGWQGASGDSSWGFGEKALGFQVAPNDPNKIALSDFGYLHLSTDGGATWRQAYLNPADQNAAGAPTPKHKPYRGVGLEDTSALWLTWVDANTMFAGYTDITGVRSTDAGSSWAFPSYNPRQNTIYQVSADAKGILYAAASTIHDLYQSTHLTDARIDGGKGQVLFSIDAGATWNTLHDFAHPVVYSAIDPANPNRMYTSVVSSAQGGIYVTNNLSRGINSTWVKLANPPRTEGHPYDIRVLKDGSLVATYSARRTTTFTASSGTFISTDSGATSIDRTDTARSGMKYYTKEVTIDPNDASQNTWYVGVRSGWGGTGNNMGGLYKTTDRGLHWSRIFDTDSCESVTIAATGEMYLATSSSGLWYSAGGAAATFRQLPAYPFRQPERVFINPFKPSEVWVASLGYGLAVAQVDSAPP